LFHSFFATLTVFFALFLIVSAYSGNITPEKNILFAYSGLCFPVLLIVNILLLIYWIIVKKWLLSFLLIVTFVICYKPITVFSPIHLKTNDLPHDELIKVLSYNVMSFAYKNHTQADPNKIIQYIAESEADIVCLQEYMVSSRHNLMSSQDVAEALPMYPYIAETILSSADNKNYKYGIALLSKFPILSSRRISFPSVFNGSAIHELNVNGKKVTVVNNHLESFKLTAEDRSKYSDMFTRVSFESFDEFRGTIQQKLGKAFAIRAKQAEKIADEIRKANGYYTIVCGDFNDTPLSYAHHTIQGSLLDAYAESGLGMGISYNQNLFYFRLDHIFHSISMNAYNCRVDTRIKLSDHYPIYCYLKLH
jgi:endonuclease/exonuclease/phosphatase family metal-dependent hydrolase